MTSAMASVAPYVIVIDYADIAKSTENTSATSISLRKFNGTRLLPSGAW